MSSGRESIFTNILKRFFGAFVSVYGFLLAVLVFFLMIGAAYKGNASAAGDTLPMKVERANTGFATTLNKSAPIILKINIHGLIGMPSSTIMNTHETIAKILRQPALYGIDMDQVKGIFLSINSPGGGTIECDNIYQELLYFKKKYNLPVHVSVDGLCASAGYYIACVGDHISATSPSIIGSVGVLYSNPHFNFFGLMQKLGIEATPIAAGKNKQHFPMFSPKPKGTESYQDFIDILNALYDDFLEVVSTARGKFGLTKEKLREIGATIYIASKAQQLGYIDQTNTRPDIALQQFANSVGIDEEAYQVISFDNPLTLLQNIQGKFDNMLSFFSRESIELPFEYRANFESL